MSQRIRLDSGLWKSDIATAPVASPRFFNLTYADINHSGRSSE
jgi:hypothetical protein